MTIHVLGISGSLRKGSYNTRLLKTARDLAPENMYIEIYPLGDLPMYNQDLVTDNYPLPVQDFRQAVREADALLFASPEYNYSVTPALKNAIDWASRPDVAEPKHEHSPLYHKPLAIMGAGGRFGTVRVQMHLQAIASATKMIVVPDPQVFVKLYPEAPFDEAGNLTDPMARQLIVGLLENLREMTYQLQRSAEALAVK